MREISKAEIDKLGERLRVSPHTETDLRLLDEYKRSYQQTFEITVRILQERLLRPTVRPSKSNLSIVAKLRRQPKLRLSRMQDIAGCRIVAADIVEQDQIIETLKIDFPRAVLKDRRKEPSHGYRAVHAMAKVAGKIIEIQVRSLLQHLWAELSERAADAIDPEIKYGGGEAGFQQLLQLLSNHITRYENEELEFIEAERSNPISGPIARALHEDHRRKLTQERGMISEQLKAFSALCDEQKKGIK
jgi:putative GTP pyrophosphokinase